MKDNLMNKIWQDAKNYATSKEYWKRLKEHPGLGYAFGLTLAGFLAGASNENAHHWYAGAVLGIVCFGMVLWSNRK